MARSKAVLIVTLLLPMAGCAPEKPLFPDDVDGWTPAGPEESYAPEALHRYIDGAAEVYLALGVKGVRAARYAKPDAPEIVADVFDMGSAAHAYGAFHHDVREGADAGIGRESAIDGTALAFWKGPHFASVIALGEGDGVREAVLALGRRIAGALPDGGAPPPIAARLPERGLVGSRVHLVTSPALLNRHYFVADDDLLGFGEGIEGILATYRTEGDDEAYRLLVVAYPRAEQANAALARLRSGYLPEADARGLAVLPNGRWSGARLQGSLLVLVFDAPSAAVADGALIEAGARMR